MILPNNGKVVVIDDEYDDVKKLIFALSKEKVPVLFFSDRGGEDLPPINEPIENIRLIFLDLDLGVASIGGDMQMIRVVQGRLVRVLKKNTPYVLVVWSNHEDALLKTLLEELEKESFKDYKPLANCSLDKGILKKYEGNDIVEEIRKGVKDCLKTFATFNAFLLWEASVNYSAGIITNNLTNIFARDNNWDKNLCNLLFTLSQAQTGKDTVGDLNEEEKLATSFEIINSTLTENVETHFKNKIKEITISEIKLGGKGIETIEKDKINTSIHLIKSNSLKHFFSGNLYINNLDEYGHEILKHNFKDTKLPDVIKANPKLICLDVTPSCDYSRRKNYSRILYGVLVSGNFNKSDLRSEDCRYTLCPNMELDYSSYLLFDYRHFYTFTQKNFILRFPDNPNYRIRNSLLLDIQAQLSNHINRPGVVTL